jgi:WXG100 family type VII secretion target
VPNSITVGYEGLRQAAQQLRTGKQELDTTLRELQTLVGDLTSSGFKTRVASTRFGQHHRQWTDATAKLVTSLDDISRAVQDAQQKHEQADSSLAEGVGALGATAAGAGGAAKAVSGSRSAGGGGGTGGGGGGGTPGGGSGPGTGGGGGRQPKSPSYDVVPGNQVTQRMREIDQSKKVGWGQQHPAGDRYAYDHVKLPNGDRYTRTQGMQVTVRKSMLPDGPRTSSPPRELKKSDPGYDNRYKLQLGHLWADRLGGANASRNFVPVHPGVNGGGMRYIEGQVAAAVNKSGSVELVALPQYVGNEPIPRSILYAWKAPEAENWTAVLIKNLP